MPNIFSSDASHSGGRTGLDAAVTAGVGQDAERTGGNVAADFPVETADVTALCCVSGGDVAAGFAAAGGVEGREDADYYKYRHLNVRPETHYSVELLDSMGRLKWADDFHNLVTTAGLTCLIDSTFKTGLETPAWFVGLVDGAVMPAYDAGDTSASHPGWTENTNYAAQTRPAFVPGMAVAGACDNTAARAVFSIDAPGTIAGCFLANSDSKNADEDLVYGVGAFSGGNRAVEDGDTLRVTCTVSAS